MKIAQAILCRWISRLVARGGIEPPMEDLQSPALPLCYPATPIDSIAMTALIVTLIAFG